MALLLAVSASLASGCDVDFVFVLADRRFGDLEFHRQFLKLLRVDAFGLDDLALPQQLHGEVFQLATDQPQRGVDARLLLHVAIRLITGDADGDIPHVALFAQRDGVNWRFAAARREAGFHRIDHFKVMAVRQQNHRVDGFVSGRRAQHGADGFVEQRGLACRARGQGRIAESAGRRR